MEQFNKRAKICLLTVKPKIMHFQHFKIQSSEVHFEVRKFKPNFVTKFGSTSANFGKSRPTSEDFGKSYVKSTVRRSVRLEFKVVVLSKFLRMYVNAVNTFILKLKKI